MEVGAKICCLILDGQGSPFSKVAHEQRHEGNKRVSLLWRNVPGREKASVKALRHDHFVYV